MTRALRGLATGIGSLPFTDAGEAVEAVVRACPALPFWPQLPTRTPLEGMLAQFMQQLPATAEDLETFYEHLIAHDVGYFKITQDRAQGLYAFRDALRNNPAWLPPIQFLKCHITGPFTAAAGMKGQDGKAYLHDPTFLQALLKGLAMKALWQIDFLKEFKKPFIVFIDEPYLGCFGSAYTPLNREDAVAGLLELTGSLHSDTVLTGVHCCGNTDWSILTDVSTLDIINFDAFSFSEEFLLYAEDIKRFIARGGILCWGIVPTQEPLEGITALNLAGKIMAKVIRLERKGVDKRALLEQMLVSPACGLGTMAAADAHKTLQLLQETSRVLQEEVYKYEGI